MQTRWQKRRNLKQKERPSIRIIPAERKKILTQGARRQKTIKLHHETYNKSKQCPSLNQLWTQYPIQDMGMSPRGRTKQGTGSTRKEQEGTGKEQEGTGRKQHWDCWVVTWIEGNTRHGRHTDKLLKPVLAVNSHDYKIRADHPIIPYMTWPVKIFYLVVRVKRDFILNVWELYF